MSVMIRVGRVDDANGLDIVEVVDGAEGPTVVAHLFKLHVLHF